MLSLILCIYIRCFVYLLLFYCAITVIPSNVMKQIFYQQITNTWTFIFWILYLLYTVEGAPQRPVLNVRGSDCEACWKQLLWLFSTRPQIKMVHFCYWKPFSLMLTIARNHWVLNLESMEAMEAWNAFQSLYRQKCRISFFSWLMQCVGQ